MVNRDEMNHLKDEEWDRNRAKRERMAECKREAELCGSKRKSPKSGTDQST